MNLKWFNVGHKIINTNKNTNRAYLEVNNTAVDFYKK